MLTYRLRPMLFPTLKDTTESNVMTKKPFFPSALRDKFLNALMKRHRSYLRTGESFDAEAEVMPDGWTFKVTFQSQDRSTYLPVELVFLQQDNPGVKDEDARDALMDFADYFFGEYFRDAREVTLPIDWKAFPFGELTIRARGWERNLKLEQAADMLLAGVSLTEVQDKL